MSKKVSVARTGHLVSVPAKEIRGFIANVLRSLNWENIQTPRDLREINAVLREKNQGHSSWNFEYKLSLRYQAEGSTVRLDYRISETQVGMKSKCQQHLDELARAIDRLAADFVATAEAEEAPETYGSAQFADEAELEQKGYLTNDTPSNRLLLAPMKDKYITVPAAFTNMHALVCGPTGSGKSSGFFVPNIVARDRVSLIVTEATAGDEMPQLYADTAGWRAFKGSNVYFFNPGYAKGTRINPLDRLKAVKPSEFAPVADELANLVIVNTTPPMTQRADPIWDKSEKHLLWIFIMHVAKSEDPELTHFGAIREILRKSDQEITQILQTSKSAIARDEYASFLAHSSENFRHGVFSGLLQRLNPWLSDVIQTMTKTTDLDLQRLKHENFSFYLSVPSRKAYLKPIAALIFNFLLDLVLSEEFENPPALLLDEFTNFGAIPQFEDALSLIRKRNLPAVLGMQTYDQLEKVYGKIVAQTMISQLATRVFFRPRNLWQAEQISRELGERTVIEKRTDDRGSTSVRELGQSLLSARELQTLNAGEVVILTESTNPIKTQRFDHVSFPAPTAFDLPDLIEHDLVKTEPLNDVSLAAIAQKAKRKAESEPNFSSTRAAMNQMARNVRAEQNAVPTTVTPPENQTEKTPPQVFQKPTRSWSIPG